MNVYDKTIMNKKSVKDNKINELMKRKLYKY